MAANLEQRIQRLDDLDAIGRLFQDYRRFLDGRDIASYPRLYTEDGVYATGSGRFAQGPAAIQALVEGMVGRGRTSTAVETFHVYANPVIDLDGDSAVCQLTWALVQRGEDGSPSIGKLGRYDAVAVRAGGEWKLQRRDSTLLIGSPT